MGKRRNYGRLSEISAGTYKRFNFLVMLHGFKGDLIVRRVYIYRGPDERLVERTFLWERQGKKIEGI